MTIARLDHDVDARIARAGLVPVVVRVVSRGADARPLVRSLVTLVAERRSP